MYRSILPFLMLLAVPCLATDYYVLQGVNKKNVRDSILQNPRVAGLSIRVSWDRIETSPGVYDWSYLDEQTSRHSNYMLRVIAGDDTPYFATSVPWIRGIPNPADPLARERYRALHEEIAERYNPTVVHACGPSVCELHLPGRKKSWWDDRYEEELVTGVTQRLSDLTEVFEEEPAHEIASFESTLSNSQTRIALNHSPQPWSPQVLAAAEDLGVIAQMNALSARINPGWVGYQAILNHEGDVGWQMLSRSSSRRFGGAFKKALIRGDIAEPLYYEIYANDIGALPSLKNPAFASVPEPAAFPLICLGVLTLSCTIRRFGSNSAVQANGVS